MTEAEWLACEVPAPMLEFLGGKASDRKVRLFTVACARTLWDELSVEDMRTAVELGERFADGEASDADRQEIMSRLYSLPTNSRTSPGTLQAFFSELARGRYAGYLAALVTVRPAGILEGPSWAVSSFATGRHQPTLLRDIFGPLPFRPVAFEPAGRTSTVVALASQMYDSRDFSPMPILADALQDAGCDNPDILDHCRGEGPHVRGCWVVDLVLGKS